MTGSRTSSGSSSRDSLTLAITSVSTSEVFSPRRTCTSIEDTPGLLVDVMYSTPRAPAMLTCNGVVTKPWIVRALAPGYTVST
jgi:hypothetical protein